MVGFTVNRALMIRDAVKCGYYKLMFDELVDLYNNVFGVNQHPRCAPCSRARLEGTLQSWYSLCVRKLRERGVDLDDPDTYPADLDAVVNNSNPSPRMSGGYVFEIPLGLGYRSMTEEQRKVYRLWSDDKRKVYKDTVPVGPSKVSEDLEPVYVSEHERIV